MIALNGFVWVTVILSIFLTLYGILLLWLSQRVSKDESIISISKVFVVFGLFYIALAHFGMASTMLYGVTQTNLAPCEWLVNQSVTSGTTTTTTNYTYYDGCSSRTIPESINVSYKLYMWLIYIDLLAIVLGGLYLLFRWMGRWL